MIAELWAVINPWPELLRLDGTYLHKYTVSMLEFEKRKVIVLIYSALILSTLVVFWQVRNFEFTNYDDNCYVTENQHFSNGLNGGDIIWAFTTPNIGNWLPLTWLSFMLDIHLFGMDAGRMHLVNLFLHIANTLLLLAVLKMMTGAPWRSAFVAAAFALHPMHVESVAWVIERKDVLSTFFFMLTLAAYVGYVRQGGLFRYLLAILLFVSGLLAKPMLVSLPFVLLLLDYWPLERIREQRTEDRRQRSKGASQKVSAVWLIVEKVPFFALAAVWSVITFLAQRSSGAVIETDVLPFYYRIANVLLSYIRYIGKLFWPQNLAVFYPFDIKSFSFWQIAMCAMLLAVITVLAIRFGRKHRYLAVGWFWFVITLIPVIGLVQSSVQGYADRYTYISYIGLFIMIAWGLPELLSKWPHRKIALGVSMVTGLTILGICAHQQVSYWNNSLSLFSHAIKVIPNNYIAYNNLGVACDSAGRHEDAIENYKQAVRIKPNYAEAYYNLGGTYGKVGRQQDAIEAYKQAVRIKPDYAKALCNLGVAYDEVGRRQEAIEAYRQAIRIKPDFEGGHYNLGNACLSVGRWQNAIEAYKQAIKLKPDYAEAHNNLGNAYLVLGRYQDAAEAYKQAIKIKPDYTEAQSNLGVAYEGLGRYQDAVEACKQAIKIKPDYAMAHHNLGVAYEGLGRNQDAVEAYKQAIRISPDYADAYINLGVTYFNLGRYQDAIEPYKQAIRIRPDFVFAHYNLCVAYLVNGDKESALEEYKILKTLDAEQANELFKLINK